MRLGALEEHQNFGCILKAVLKRFMDGLYAGDLARKNIVGLTLSYCYHYLLLQKAIGLLVGHRPGY